MLRVGLRLREIAPMGRFLKLPLPWQLHAELRSAAEPPATNLQPYKLHKSFAIFCLTLLLKKALGYDNIVISIGMVIILRNKEENIQE